MKNLFIALVITFVMLPSQSKAQTASEMQACESLSNFARFVMREKYNGTSFISSLRICDDRSGRFSRFSRYFTPENWHFNCRSVTHSAYSRPDFTTEEWQQYEISRFVNAVELSCIESFNQ
jgi:hypothetical protein